MLFVFCFDISFSIMFRTNDIGLRSGPRPSTIRRMFARSFGVIVLVSIAISRNATVNIIAPVIS